MDRRHMLVLTAGACSLGLSGHAFGQAYPDRPIRLTVGFPPGTGPDTVARIVSQKLVERLKQPMTVDNRTGAGGQIAVQGVAKSAPDGYNLLLAEVGSISIAPAAFDKLTYDPLKELIAVSEVARADFLLVVPTQSPVKSAAEFVQAAKARSGRTNFATFGAGTPGHFGAELFAAQGGFKIEPVHYRSTGDAVTAIVAGDVEGAFVTTALGSAQVKGGKVRALATTADARSKLLPDVPTFAEVGMPKVDFSSWLAFFVPAGTPEPVVATLNRAIVEAMRDPQVKDRLEESGFRVIGSSAADAAKMVRSESQRWGQIVKATGFKGN
ncbi:tripartite tricarboxylate transporter substrate binding protein [Ramlibacter sp. AW1]|uniref:Tripartite tricarboxylate transporter substrate binding protein n=1 Tax=Ramlibacter aurantiacus TaxID=2801330 RepID=A0A936ZM68_9BURK|nr:tripartite tricarboxylate transporter substrate binding protein [Ramlibacter aurantiacus]